MMRKDGVGKRKETSAGLWRARLAFIALFIVSIAFVNILIMSLTIIQSNDLLKQSLEGSDSEIRVDSKLTTSNNHESTSGSIKKSRLPPAVEWPKPIIKPRNVADDSPPMFDIDIYAPPIYNSPSLRIIVMTYSRTESFKRLLTSLANAEYNRHRIDLDIWIDKPENGPIHQDILAVAQDFAWNFGIKNIHQRGENAGLRKQWIYTWTESIEFSLSKSTPERVLILEDDLELSKYFFLWLNTAHNVYGERDNIAGFTLQRANLCVADCPPLSGGPIPGNFLYNLVGSWGFSPTAKHWVNFMSFFEKYDEINHRPYIEGITPTKWYKSREKDGRCPGKNCMWTMLHLKYFELHTDRFVVYTKPAKQRTLSSNWQESGLHYAHTFGKDFATLDFFDNTIFEFPVDLKRLNWHGKVEKFAYLEEAKFLNSIFDFVNIQFFNYGFLEMTKHWICNVAYLDSQLVIATDKILPRTLFIAIDEQAYIELIHFGRIASTSVGYDVSLNVVLDKFPANSTSNINLVYDYGQVEYYRLMNWRAHQLNRLLANGIKFMLTEADSVWLKNPFNYIRNELRDDSPADLILFDDKPNERVPQGGFMYFNPTPKTLYAWKLLVESFDEIINQFKSMRGTKNIGEKGNEQYILDNLFKKLESQNQLTLHWLDTSLFVSGQWYRKPELRSEEMIEMVVLFNWIIGNEQKIIRAKKFSQWFLTSGAQCKNPR